MKAEELICLMEDAGQRHHFIGSEVFGVIAALDREGRLFTVLGGEVVSRVDAEALMGISTRDRYCNPGGDVLWPAPEGTCFGYEYSSGKWRVPPGITGARYIVKEENENSALIEAEVDLINSMGAGVPCVFERGITLNPAENKMSVKETVTYIGRVKLGRDRCMLAPWSLSQFDNGPDAEVVFPDLPDTVWDLYEPSGSQRFIEGELCHSKTDRSAGYQIALAEEIEWIEYRNPGKNLSVRRTAGKLPGGFEYIDITDAPPEREPGSRGVRFSAYNDMDGFMEIEAVGGCPSTLEPGTSSSVEVITVFGVLE